MINATANIAEHIAAATNVIFTPRIVVNVYIINKDYSYCQFEISTLIKSDCVGIINLIILYIIYYIIIY